MTLPPDDLSTPPGPGDSSLTGWQRVIIAVIFAGILITIVVVTRSTEAIALSVPSLVVILKVLSPQRRSP
jgi:hypothetical protein